MGSSALAPIKGFFPNGLGAASREKSMPSVLQIGKFYPPHWGGIETHLQWLCADLRRSTDLSVIVSNKSSETVEQLIDDVPVLRLGRKLEIAGASVCPDLVDRIRSSSAAIVHLHVPNPPAVLAYLASRHTGKLVVAYHSDVVRQKALSRLFEPFLQMLLRRADAILVTSPNYLQTSRSLRRHKERCHVVPLGVPTRFFDLPESAEVNAIRKRHGQRLIVSVGRLVHYKGFEFLIRAMRSVGGHLLLVGKGPLKGRLVALAAEVGVADRVSFVGELSSASLQATYHAADLFVLPSICRSEAFGMVQVEAMAAGLPVVNTDLPSGVPFVSRHGVTGLTVPPRDPEALANAINWLLDSPRVRAEYGGAARERALTEFASSVMAERTLDVYRSILDFAAN